MGESVWGITSYFNPASYENRRRNYRAFREHLSVPLIAVELAFDNPFELGPEDADVLVQVRGRDVLWQKEPLLEIGRRHLPPDCGAVCFIDADVLFEQKGWAEQVSDVLREKPAMQLYRKAHHMPEGWRPGDAEAEPLFTEEGQCWVVDQVGDVDQVLPGKRIRGVDGRGVGYAYALRRDLFERHGLYKYCVAGGGDTALFCAAYQRPEYLAEKHNQTPRMAQKYREWAEPFGRDVQGRVGYLPGDIRHLWHGSMSNRYGGARHLALAELTYDPYTDVELDESGLLRWSTDKPELHRFLREYFAMRHEDGVREEATV